MEKSRIQAGTAKRDASGKIALVQGASRGIGLAMTEALLAQPNYARVFASCRSPDKAKELRLLQSRSKRLSVLRLDVLDQGSIEASAAAIHAATTRLDLLVNCAGVLHEAGRLGPEKRLADVEAASMDYAFRVNALGPLLVARAFERVLRASPAARFAALSARVGSITDNRRGGWYAYRASKAALNMMIRTLAIEWARLARPISCFALHPGTVATDLSAPFRKNQSP
jgi:NAD(P)-dependent dehydrogenase (short-subunit alcohol dehydrogenase family)